MKLMATEASNGGTPERFSRLIHRVALTARGQESIDSFRFHFRSSRRPERGRHVKNMTGGTLLAAAERKNKKQRGCGVFNGPWPKLAGAALTHGLGEEYQWAAGCSSCGPNMNRALWLLISRKTNMAI